MPDAWERRCKLDLKADDSQMDNDNDGLVNIDELALGTLPCQADTDRGGERDGSEVNGQRNPLFAPDDLVRPLGHLSVVGLNKMIRIQWTHPISYTNMVGWMSTDPAVLGRPVDMGVTGIFTFTNVPNDIPFIVRLAGQKETAEGTAEGEYSDPFPVTAKADPDAPSGVVLINNGAIKTFSKDVVLFISSADTPLNGLAQSANAHLGGPLALQYNEVSANIQVRIANEPSFAGAVWEPLLPEKPWVLPAGPPGVYTVYAQFRDGAGNESFVVADTIDYSPIFLFLPIVRR